MIIFYIFTDHKMYCNFLIRFVILNLQSIIKKKKKIVI